MMYRETKGAKKRKPVWETIATNLEELKQLASSFEKTVSKAEKALREKLRVEIIEPEEERIVNEKLVCVSLCFINMTKQDQLSRRTANRAIFTSLFSHDFIETREAREKIAEDRGIASAGSYQDDQNTILKPFERAKIYIR